MDWGQVLFSDESKFNLCHSDGRRQIWRCKGERYEDDTLHTASLPETCSSCFSCSNWSGRSSHRPFHGVGELSAGQGVENCSANAADTRIIELRKALLFFIWTPQLYEDLYFRIG